jgi:hypothetical protein
VLRSFLCFYTYDSDDGDDASYCGNANLQ